MRLTLAFVVITSSAIIASCAAPPAPPPPAPILVDTVAIPLSELGAKTYKGIQGGLFPNGSNAEPRAHDSLGIVHRNAIRPVNVNGIPTAMGRYVLMSIGGRDVSSAWCSSSSAPPCNSWSFTGRSVSDPDVNHSSLVIVNGAFPNSVASAWSIVSSASYNRIRDTRLAPLGLSEKQVQAIWVNLADSAPSFGLKATPADAAPQLRRLASTIRALKQRYPNLQLLFLSSAHYGGYAEGGEPGGYESGVIVKWIVESQIDQSSGRAPLSDVGDLSPSGTSAPWISWGPYVWTRGDQPRSDGWSLTRSDLDSTGARLAQPGEAKVGGKLLDFFKSSTYTRCWFVALQVCG